MSANTGLLFRLPTSSSSLQPFLCLHFAGETCMRPFLLWPSLLFKKSIYLFIWLCWVLVAVPLLWYGGAGGKEPACQCRRLKRCRFHPWVRKIPGEGHGNPSGILAWRILWVEEPGGLQAIGSQRVRHDWSNLACTHALRGRNINPQSVKKVKLDGPSSSNQFHS